MRYHQEKPDTRVDRYICLGLIAAALLAGDHLLLRLSQAGKEQPVPLLFLGLAMLAALLLYLVWVTVSLFTVRYALADHQLILQQGSGRCVIPLDRPVGLHRWRYGWGWSDGPRQDLGVEAIALFPALWFWRETPIWVVTFVTGSGERRAAAFRPSPELLELLRERIREGVA